MAEDASPRLTEDFEWEQSIRTFTASSDRVRYVMLVVVIAFCIAMFGWDNARSGTWMVGRIQNGEEMVRASGAYEDAFDCQGLEPAWRVAACQWQRPPTTQKNAEDDLKRLRDLDAQHSYYLHVPFVDVIFDVNDLGMATGFVFSTLLFVLFLSLVREHENLYLCLWRIQTKFRRDDEIKDDGHSRGNLFYHALAMVQVFANPPTLGRWNRSYIDLIPDLTALLLLVPQFLILRNDCQTAEIGLAEDYGGTLFSLGSQYVMLVVVVILAISSLGYAKAGAAKWKRCFRTLNPKLSRLPSPSEAKWRERKRGPRRGVRGPDGYIQDPSGKRILLSTLVAGREETLLVFMPRAVVDEHGRVDRAPCREEDRDFDVWRYEKASSEATAAGTGSLKLVEEGNPLQDEQAFRVPRLLWRRWYGSHLCSVKVGSKLEIRDLSWWTVLVRKGAEAERKERQPKRMA